MRHAVQHQHLYYIYSPVGIPPPGLLKKIIVLIGQKLTCIIIIINFLFQCVRVQLLD